MKVQSIHFGCQFRLKNRKLISLILVAINYVFFVQCVCFVKRKKAMQVGQLLLAWGRRHTLGWFCIFFFSSFSFPIQEDSLWACNHAMTVIFRITFFGVQLLLQWKPDRQQCLPLSFLKVTCLYIMGFTSKYGKFHTHPLTLNSFSCKQAN